MKILFLGNFDAQFSSENYYLKTLTEMGHQVIPMQEGRVNESNLMYQVINNKPDLFFWVSTHGWPTPGIENFLQWCRNNGVVSFAYHLDLWMGIARERDLRKRPFFTVDHFFTVDKLMADWMNENHNLHLAKAHFLPAGVYEGECFMGTPNPEKYPHDIIFTGSKHYHPEWPYRTQLIDWLQETYGSRFGHYGPGGLESVRGPELNNLYASAKVVVGDTLCKGFNYPWYSSDRLFECAGRGAFLIYPEIHGMKEWYLGVEVNTYPFNDWQRLKSMIDNYLTIWNADRAEYVERALARTKAEHTYRHRFETILKTLKPELC